MKRTRWMVLPLLGALALVVAACGGDDDDNGSETENGDNGGDQAATVDYASPELLETTETLQEKLDDDNVAIVDLRDREDYEAEHIPGAVWYDRSMLKNPDDDVHVVTGDQFSELLGEIGIDNDTSIVAYDEGHGLLATRFWWVLNYYDHEDASVLNGGFAKWTEDGGETSSEVPEPESAVFEADVDESVYCAADDVLEVTAEENDDVVLLDVRSNAEYTGSDVRADRGGHIPGAVNLDWSTSMTGDPQVWKSADELIEQFNEVGIEEDTEVITYCQTAVRAAHSFFTLELVGLGQAQNYDGSWNEWGNLEDTPIEQ